MHRRKAYAADFRLGYIFLLIAIVVGLLAQNPWNNIGGLMFCGTAFIIFGTELYKSQKEGTIGLIILVGAAFMFGYAVIEILKLM